jgi:hypothetical protein
MSWTRRYDPGLKPEIAFVVISLSDVSASVWDLVLLLVPFGCTGALVCTIFWRMVIRRQRHARLTAKQAANAIRAME